MSEQKSEAQFDDLIPELRAWNNGTGIDPKAWVGIVGNYELAVGYSLLFWPQFVVVDNYVLKKGVTEELLRDWERVTSGNVKAIESVINHIHIADIHGGQPTEDQLRYLGRTLKSVYEAKLATEFPERTFVVIFNDQPGLGLLDYQLTFWQA